jgi:inorganic triphosphatase YgiF
VGEGFRLPALDGVADLQAVDRGTHVLEATYWDTPTLALFNAQWGLRHRTCDGAGGTWTLKGPSVVERSLVAREEIEMPGAPQHVPKALLEQLRPMLDDAALQPLLRMRTERHIVELWTRDVCAVEVADDSVSVLDTDGREAMHFREVELELRDVAGGEVADAVLPALLGEGATADPTPKYARALRALALIP